MEAIAPLAALYAAWATEPINPAPDEVLMIRASLVSPALERARQYDAAWREGAAWPITCTRRTASHSASSEFTNMRSRTIPALFTTACSPPKDSIASCTISPAASQSATSCRETTAVPPAAVISSTTCCAGVSDGSLPSWATPRSLTTTDAPECANANAWALPRPRPAPVTITERPSQIPIPRI
ncbi:MAG: hypothetical protein M5U19_17590 [Microthrixaceae bacterium]|nr:hypothetical protein [Microthrixaceae bacterium]